MRPLACERFEFKDLGYFVAVADASGIRRAAAQLGARQSVVSRRLRNLEDELGVSLFDRHSGGVRLTSAARRLPHAGRRFRGRHVGLEAARECYRQVAAAKPELVYRDPLHIARQGDTVVIEFEDDGMIGGQPYRNRIVGSFDVRGGKICGYREHMSDVDADVIARMSGQSGR